MSATRIRSALATLVAIFLSTCVLAQEMQPFSTDGCSMFPDRSLINKSDWCSCCLAHDLAYWRGGTADERLKADQDLKTCVFAAYGKEELADLMLAGVRAGGGPYFFTPYRWGYGWRFGRLYEPLTAAEEAQYSAQRALYISSNPDLTCSNASQ
jgi:hypothetical protein